MYMCLSALLPGVPFAAEGRWWWRRWCWWCFWAPRADTFTDKAAFPEGLQTLIDDQSTKMSGGQQQRLVLARALLRKSRVLLLDEAFSALDRKSRASIEVRMIGWAGV
jgi:ABC-type Mn2+/Zn2+ transport system ATPase subunit